MSLPFRERTKLRALARAAARDDPELAVRFALFNHASRDVEMPFAERLRARAVRRRQRAERVIDQYPAYGWPDLLLPARAVAPHRTPLPGTARKCRAACGACL
jgi:hypothetical protein